MKQAQNLIEIFDRNHNNHIPYQDWFTACGGLNNSFDESELEEITESAISYRLASCKKSQSEIELRQEIETNYRKSHANIGATIATRLPTSFYYAACL